MVCCRKYSVPHYAVWPTFIMGSAGPCFGRFYEAPWPFPGASPLFLCPQRETLTLSIKAGVHMRDQPVATSGLTSRSRRSAIASSVTSRS
jgi:hypothetical protein